MSQIHSIKQLQFNRAQLMSLLYPVKTKMEMWGRGSGKTFLMAYDSKEAAHDMPGASFVIVGRSYANLEDIVLPGLIASWKALGFHPGLHYEINRKPDKKKGWPDPFVAPLSYDHYIPWYTGAGFYIASQDKDTPFRGPSIDGVYVDEALNINKDKFDEEIVPTNRGRRFNHPLHHFYRFYSTKPKTTGANWMYKHAEFMDPDLLRQYRRMQKAIAEMTIEFLELDDRGKQKRLFEEIKKLKSKIRWFADQRNLSYYAEFDFWDNIPNISIADVLNMKQNMSSINFRIEVLNETFDEIDGGFYSTFKSERHVVYDTYNYTHIDKLSSESRRKRDCRWDADLIPGQPLRVAVDWGGVINSALVWQRNDRRININNHQYAEHPRKIRDLARDFIEYYAHHYTKHVLLWFDHTGNNRQANSEKTNAQEFAGYLRDAGWTVSMMSKGGAPTHEWKYYKAQSVFGEEDPRLPIIRINGNNCPHLVTAMNLTPIKRGNNKIEKDKSSERDKLFPQYQATHVTDCLDIIIRAETEGAGMREFRDVILG